jgi:hypothetical protein
MNHVYIRQPYHHETAKDKRIEALEDAMSSGFQELSGRDVADALIDNANMRDRIAALEKKLKCLTQERDGE